MQHHFPWFRRSSGKRAARRIGRRYASVGAQSGTCAEVLERRELLTAISMTAQEQLLLELVNRARLNPRDEAILYGIDPATISTTPVQPLAPNQILINVAGAHSQDMLDQDYFDHTGKDGRSPSDRATDAGYPVGVGENLAWGGLYPATFPIDQTEHVYERHEGLFKSPGHRLNILEGSYQELGTGVRYGYFTDPDDGKTYNASMVTENFGNPPGNPFLTGVVFTDASDGSANDDNFFSVGEQVSSGTITAVRSGSGTSYSTTIGPSGGYSMQLPSGTYTVTLSIPSLGKTYTQSNVIVTTQNVKVDFETTSGDGVSQIFVLSSPASGTFAPGASVPIGWTADGVLPGSKISLAYDEDTIWWNGNEHWITVDQIVAANGTGTHNWNTTGVTPGTYYIAGYLYDFAGSFILSHLTTSFQISAAQSFVLSGPASGTYASGSSVPITWTASAVPPGSRISLAYDEDTIWWNGNEHWIAVDQIAAANGNGTYNWNTTGVASGTYYLAGYMYDFAGTFTFSHLTTSFQIAAPQSFVLTGPASASYVSGTSVQITWTANGVVSGSKISLGYDADTIWWNGNEQWITIDQVAAANGNGVYNWNTAGMSAGTYYVMGYMYDYAGTFTFSHLTQSFQITAASLQTFALTGPTSGTYTVGTIIPIQWTASGVVSGAKISLGYDADTTWWNGNERWITIDQIAATNGSGTYNWNTAGVSPGTYYAMGYMYDFAGTFTASHLTSSFTLGNTLLVSGGGVALAQPVAHPQSPVAHPQSPVAHPQSVALESLTDEELSSLVTTAIGLWSEAGLSAESVAALQSVEFVVTDLSGDQLGLTTTDTIYIDRDAAGYGWYVEAESGEWRAESQIEGNPKSEAPNSKQIRNANLEARNTSGQESRVKSQDSGSRVDLLTVVAHELGHVLGVGHDSGDDVMEGLLPLGVRRLPGLEDIDAAFASGWDDYLAE